MAMLSRPQFPLYIPTKGRSEYMITSRQLTRMGVKHYVVVEPSEVDVYTRACRDLLAEVLPLDMSYKGAYDTCDDPGQTLGTGAGPARNFAWEHSIANGFDRHWVMDDNITAFYRMNRNAIIRVESPAFWTAMEDFCLRYLNVAMAGPNYEMFVRRREKIKPFSCNTRIYSCNLIRNDLPFRWRGRYNEDVILSLDMLTAGWCTIQFNAFLQNKMGTQLLKGGNTDELYQASGHEAAPGENYSKTGTTAKSQMLADLYPNVAKVVWKFGRVHHEVDYQPFKFNKLVKRPGAAARKGNNEYGMHIVRKSV